MIRHTSIFLPLAISRKRRLEEAAEARGATLESFILEAAEAEAQRIGRRLSEEGHSVDHAIYTTTDHRAISGPLGKDGEHQIATHRVALELGWDDGSSEDWLGDVDRLIEGLDSLDGVAVAATDPTLAKVDSRRSSRREVRRVHVLNPVQGVVLDMSETGLGIETQGPFSVPEEVYLSIGQSVSCAKIRAQVRWCVLVRTESFHDGDVVPIYRSGLAFLGH